MLISGCELLDPAEQIPSYLQIDSFHMVDNPIANEGSLSHDIRDAWVFVDDELIGIYELPAKIPVLQSGNHKLTIGPGILVSANSTIRDNYPFYNAYTDDDFLFESGVTHTVSPVSSYRDPGNTYAYEIIDDFESIISQIDSFSGSQVPLIRTNEEGFVFEGEGSGLAEIKSTDTAAYFRSDVAVLPGNGKTTYLEIDYYSDYTFTVYGRAINTDLSDQTFELLTLKPTTDEDGEEPWKKVYINMTSMTSGASNPEGFYIFFSVVGLSNPSDRKDGFFALDNLKFVYQR